LFTFQVEMFNGLNPSAAGVFRSRFVKRSVFRLPRQLAQYYFVNET
jgi:hypothetical protein